MSDSSQPHGPQPTRLLCPWDFPGNSTGVGCHCLLLNKAEIGVFLEFSCFFHVCSVSCPHQPFLRVQFQLTFYINQRRQWHPTPVLLPGKSHGRRSLVSFSPWGCEESDTTERLQFTFHFHFSLSCIGEGNGNPLQSLAWRIPGMGEPGRLLSMGLHRVQND